MLSLESLIIYRAIIQTSTRYVAAEVFFHRNNSQASLAGPLFADASVLRI